MLGIIIGVGAVIIIMSVGAGAQSLILDQIKTLGTDLVGILPGNSGEDGPPTAVMGVTITTLKYEDAQELKKKKNVPNVADVVAYTKGAGALVWKSNSYDTSFSGCSASYMNVEGGIIEEGRFFNEDEETNLSKVLVLGSTVKKELFGNSQAIGEKVKLNKHLFEVIGVMSERGTVAFQNYDDQVFLPIKTMQKLIAGVDHLGMIRVRVDSSDNIDKAMSDIKLTLREQHDIKNQEGFDDDFTVRSSADALDIITTITDALTYFLTTMSALSLLVGGIGIMNIMLVNVTERTREIGLKKAIGARRINILSQFLIEAIFVTLFGGIIGILFGVFISYLISVGAHLLGYNWNFIIDPFSIFLGISVSTLIGVVFGIYPANKASKLEPVEALRYE